MYISFVIFEVIVIYTTLCLTPYFMNIYYSYNFNNNYITPVNCKIFHSY